jgi:hypothetical protein
MRVRFPLLFALMAVLGSCSRGPAPLILEDHGKFIDARLSSDGQTGVITFQRPVRPPPGYSKGGGGWFYFGGSGKPLPVGMVADRNYVGVWGRSGGSGFRVVATRDNTEWLPYNGTWHVQSVEGTMALITESGQLRDYQTGPSKFYVLNTGTGEMTLVPLREEVTSSDVALAYVHAVTADGAIILNTQLPFEPLASGTMLPLWVRYPSGEYVQVSDAAVFRGVTRNVPEITYMSPRGGRIFSLQTRQSRQSPSPMLFSGAPVYPMFSLHTDSRSVRLYTSLSDQNDTVSDPLPIDPNLMK